MNRSLYGQTLRKSAGESSKQHTLRNWRKPMAKSKGGGGNDRTVYRRPDDHKWVDKRDGAERGFVFDRQSEAARSAKEHLQNAGGGELKIKGENGQIRSKDTIPPGNDSNPPRDKEH